MKKLNKGQQYYCAECSKQLNNSNNFLFVEKEIGRVFCSESCILNYFQPYVSAMEDNLLSLRNDAQDVPLSLFEKFLVLRKQTYENPDEIWVYEDRENTLGVLGTNGDKIYHYISEHFIEGQKIYYCVVCLCLDGSPSFVFLSFPTIDLDLLDAYRKGQLIYDSSREDTIEEIPKEILEKIEMLTPKLKNSNSDLDKPEVSEISESDSKITLFQKILQDHRSLDDIPVQDFQHYEGLVEPTLINPDEIWYLPYSVNKPNVLGKAMAECFIFITQYCFEDKLDTPFFMIVVAVPESNIDAETEKSEAHNVKNLTPVLAFPTMDQNLVHHFRKGLNTCNRLLGIGDSSLVA
jgi:hypothetical protein